MECDCAKSWMKFPFIQLSTIQYSCKRGYAIFISLSIRGNAKNVIAKERSTHFCTYTRLSRDRKICNWRFEARQEEAASRRDAFGNSGKVRIPCVCLCLCKRQSRVKQFADASVISESAGSNLTVNRAIKLKRLHVVMFISIVNNGERKTAPRVNEKLLLRPIWAVLARRPHTHTWEDARNELSQCLGLFMCVWGRRVCACSPIVCKSVWKRA